MNVQEFCQQLGSSLEQVHSALPEEKYTPVRDRVQAFTTEFSTQKRPIPDIVKALFELADFIQEKSATFSSQVLSQTFIPPISEKIQQLATIAFSSVPSEKKASSSDSELKAVQEQLTQAHASLDALLKSQKTDPETTQFIQTVIDDIDLLTARLEKIQKEAAAKAAARIPLGCAGLANRSNKCYAYGCLKGLWASKKFRQMIEQKAKQEEPKPEDAAAVHRYRTVQALYRLFLTFDATSPSEVIEPEEMAIKDLFEEMAKRHPALIQSAQQDATEFLNWMFADILEDKEYLFSYVEHKKRPMELKVDYCIPNIDIPQETQGNLFIIEFPKKEDAIINPQDAFDPVIVEEGIDPESILTAEQNQGRQSFEKLDQLPRTVHVHRARPFKKVPPCLFIHLWRQLREVEVPLDVIKASIQPATLAALKMTDEEIQKLFGRKDRIKIPAQAKISEVISLHTEDQRQIRYHLKGVIIHSGLDGAGHYYSYLPVNTPAAPASEQQAPDMLPQAQGVGGAAQAAGKAVLPPPPSQDGVIHAQHVTCHNDHRVFDVPLDARIQKELQQEGYVLIYDQEE